MTETRVIDDLRSGREDRTFRSTGQVLGSVAFSLGIIAILLAQVLHTTSNNTKIAGLITIAIIAVVAVRAMLWSVTARADGVRIRGMIRTHTLRWCDIDHFSLGRLGFFPAVGIVHRKHGRPLAMSAIEVAKISTGKGRADTEAMITELNRLLAAHQRSD